MSILVPLNAPDAQAAKQASERLASNGADEFYLGFHDEQWERVFGLDADINRMSGFREEANALSFEGLCETLRLLADEKATTFVTLNTAQYTSDQIGFIESHYLGAIADAGATGIICSCPQLITAARESGLEAVASTMCGVFNEDIARFYISRGATRIVLPRELSLAEIAAIIQANPDVEYEAFLMRNGCLFSDSHCLGRHHKGCYSLCSALRWAPYQLDFTTNNPASIAEAAEEAHDVYSNQLFIRACGMCALWHLKQAGVSSYKIVGRGDEIDHLCADVEITARNLEAANSANTFHDYMRSMEKPGNREVLCRGHRSCYYPEINDVKRQTRARMGR